MSHSKEVEMNEDRTVVQKAIDVELRAMVGRARRVAAAFRSSVGPRELLLGAAASQPRLVLDAARRRGIEVRRLVWALREWGPVGAVAPAAAAEVDVTAEAQELLREAAARPTGRQCALLLDAVLDPARLARRAPAQAARDDDFARREGLRRLLAVVKQLEVRARGGAAPETPRPQTARPVEGAPVRPDLTGIVLSRLGLI
jgi:hypothetical protein